MYGRIEFLDRALDAIIDRRSEVQPVAAGFAFADGPFFGRLGYMLFCDPPRNRILQYSIPPWKIGPTEGKLSVYREPSNARALTLDHQGRLLICEGKTGRVVREERDGSYTVLASDYRGKRLAGPVDLVYAIDGSIYFCDHPRRGQAARAGRSGLARIYQIPRTGDLRMAPPDCERPLGLALGPRQLDLYVTDAARMNICVFTLSPDGTLSSSRVFAELGSDRAGKVGGIKTDEEGNVYAAGPGGIWIFNAQARHLGTILLDEQPSNLCWGRGGTGLYITARHSVYFVETRIPGTRTF